MGRLRILAVLLLMTGTFSELSYARSTQKEAESDDSRFYDDEEDSAKGERETSGEDDAENPEEQDFVATRDDLKGKGLEDEKQASVLSESSISNKNASFLDEEVKVTEDDPTVPGKDEAELLEAKVTEDKSKLPSEYLATNSDSSANNSEAYTTDTPEVQQVEKDSELSNGTTNFGKSDVIFGPNAPEEFKIQARSLIESAYKDLTGRELKFSSEASFAENEEPEALEEDDLEELEEIAPISSGNKLESETEMLVEKKRSSVQKTPTEMAIASEISESASIISSPDAAEKSNLNENIIKRESTIILDSNVDVENSVAKRRSPLLSSFSLDEFEVSPAKDAASELKYVADVEQSFVEKRSIDDDVNPCDQPVVTGSCKGSIPRFYFSPQVRSCIPFTYTGCGQNSNNFGTAEDCVKTCEPNRNSRKTEENKLNRKIEFGTSASGTGIYSRNRIRRKFPLVFCSLELDVGDICPNLKRGLYLEQFFFDTRISQCAPFVYSGCGGNANRFSSMWECTQNCVTTESASIVPK